MRRIATLIATLVFAGATHAATLAVTSTDDSGAGSLRAAIHRVNASPDEVHHVEFRFPFPQYGTVRLLTPLPAIDGRFVQITGDATVNIRPHPDAGAFGIFLAGPRLEHLRMEGLRLSHGSESDPRAVGGACLSSGSNRSARLELNDMQFSDCILSMPGWALGGAVHWGAGSVAVRRSAFFGNSARSEDGIRAQGGAIYTTGALTVSDSLFVDNVIAGGGIFGGAIVAIDSVEIERSQFVRNTAVTKESAAPAGTGGAVAIDCYSDCAVRIADAYFGSNGGPQIANAGGLFVRANAGVQLPLTMVNVTFDGNEAAQGGAAFLNNVHLDGQHLTFSGNLGADAHIHVSTGTTRLSKTIMTSGSGTGCFVAGPVQAFDTLVGDDGLCARMLPGATAVAGLLPRASVLNETMSYVAFPRDSPAVDFMAAVAPCAATDARGTARPLDGNGDGLALCDLGAYEHEDERLFADGFER